MDELRVYRDIQMRTGGEIYIGVVGPVRTGKSTFIKRFMDLMVLPGIDNVHEREQARDELPQSAAGRTIMTTEPKFIPKEAVSVHISDDIQVKIRLIDCVGFMVDGASGHMEDDKDRMVKTPWYEDPIPFTKAAHIGTQKVIRDHSTIGLVITTDGSFGEIAGESFAVAEEMAVGELKQIGKPFIVVVNTTRPYAMETQELCRRKEEKYDIKTYGINEKSLFNAENIELQEQSSSFGCNIDGETKNITINVGGEHFILNALCAITVGKEMEISSDKIVKGIESFELTQKRMDIYDLKDNIKLINDAYNASFESMKASLKVLAEYKEHRKIAVLGDMFELGDFAKGLHENVGKEVAKNKIDILIASGENSKYIVKKAKEGLKSENIYYFEDKEKIEELLLKIVKPNDVILFKASNGMQFYKLAERMVEVWKK